jgi:phosphate-selective porin
VAVVDGRTPFTRFSSSGGGSLPGLLPGDFDLRQYLFETAVHYRGFGWQQEFHHKRVRDRTTGEERLVRGGYAQLGVFADELNQQWPAQLEFVGRFAIVDPDLEVASNTQREWTLGINWFFSGHRNKLTADYSWMNFEDPITGDKGNRFRLQWEWSI